jgi:hypothetical protein
MAGFKSNKQRSFYFAKKKNAPVNPSGVTKNATALPNTPPGDAGAVPAFKEPGLPKMNKFGRIKKNFKTIY